ASHHQAVRATNVIHRPTLLVPVLRRAADDKRSIELKGHVLVGFVDHAFLVGTALKIRRVSVNRIAITSLAGVIWAWLLGVEHLLRLVHPGQRALRAGNAFRHVVQAPINESLTVVEAWLEVAAQRFASTQMEQRRRPGVTSPVFGTGESLICA